MADGAPIIRDDKENQHDNAIFDWEIGDKEGTDRAFADADVVSELELHYPRSHPSPIETCGSIADFDRSTSKLTLYMTMARALESRSVFSGIGVRCGVFGELARPR